MAKKRRYRWQNEMQAIRRQNERLNEHHSEATRQQTKRNVLSGWLGIEPEPPLSDPKTRKSHSTTIAERRRRGTGEFQEWFSPESRKIVVEAMCKMDDGDAGWSS